MPTEWIIVLVVGLLLLFSAKKLPDMARGLGQSMRIFRAETRGLKEDEQQRTAPAPPPVETAAPQAQPPGPDGRAGPGARADQTVAPARAGPAQDTTPDAPRPGTTSS